MSIRSVCCRPGLPCRSPSPHSPMPPRTKNTRRPTLLRRSPRLRARRARPSRPGRQPSQPGAVRRRRVLLRLQTRPRGLKRRPAPKRRRSRRLPRSRPRRRGARSKRSSRQPRPRARAGRRRKQRIKRRRQTARRKPPPEQAPQRLQPPATSTCPILKSSSLLRPRLPSPCPCRLQPASPPWHLPAPSRRRQCLQRQRRRRRRTPLNRLRPHRPS